MYDVYALRPLMWFAMNLMIVTGILVCISFPITVCMFIVSKALLISSATVIVCSGEAIWLNPSNTVWFNVCSAVTVECCVVFCTNVAWVCLVCLLLCKEEGCFSSVFAITERMDMGLNEVPLSMSLLGLGWGLC